MLQDLPAAPPQSTAPSPFLTLAKKFNNFYLKNGKQSTLKCYISISIYSMYVLDMVMVALVYGVWPMMELNFKSGIRLIPNSNIYVVRAAVSCVLYCEL